MSRLKQFIVEIHRRSLWQVLGIYVAGSWVVLQLADTFTASLGLPNWVPQLSLVLLVVLLPVVMATAFVQEGVRPRERRLGVAKRTSALDTAVPDAPVLEPAASDDATERPGAHHRILTWRNAGFAALGAFALLGFGTAGYVVMRTLGIGPAATLVAQGLIDERDRILLADFQSRSSDPQLAEIVTEVLRADLAQSRVVRLAEPAFIGQALSRMERPASARLTEELARELAQREGIKAIVSGDVGAAGTGFVMTGRIVVPESGEILVSQRETAADSSSIIRAIDRLSSRLRERIGESLRTLAGEQPLERVTTANLEALRLYSRAWHAIDVEGDFEAGIELLEESVALDTTFAMAWRKLGMEYGNEGESARETYALTKAYEHRDRLTEHERYLAIAAYHHAVTDETDRAIRAYQNVLELDPNDGIALNNIATLYLRLREWEQAEEFGRRAIELDSMALYPYSNTEVAQVAQGRFEQGLATVEALEALHSGNRAVKRYVLQMEYGGETARHEYDRARQLSDSLKALSLESLLDRATASGQLGAISAVEGKLAEAETHYKEAAEIEARRGLTSFALESELWLVWLEISVGASPGEALRRLDNLLVRYPLAEMEPLDRPYTRLAIIYSLAGEASRARAILAEYETAVDSRFRNPMAHHRALGLAAYAEGRFGEAIRELRASDRDRCPFCAFPLMAGVFDAADQPDSVLVYYEKFMATPSVFRIRLDAVLLGPSYERLAQLYDERAGPGDLENAAKYYAMFVELWAEADPELQPKVEAAQARLEEIVRERG